MKDAKYRVFFYESVLICTKAYNLPSVNFENERTIMVVQAKSISTFLQGFGIL